VEAKKLAKTEINAGAGIYKGERIIGFYPASLLNITIFYLTKLRLVCHTSFGGSVTIFGRTVRKKNGTASQTAERR